MTVSGALARGKAAFERALWSDAFTQLAAADRQTPLEPDDLDRLARAAGVRDRVVFAGRVDADGLPAVYALSDVFVMPSRVRPAACDVEGFGLVFLEANACGKPVIGGRTGGIPEAIVDGKTGFLVEPESVADIAEHLGTVLTDRELAAEMGRQGRTRVKAHFSWADAAAQVQELVTAMVDRAAGVRA